MENFCEDSNMSVIKDIWESIPTKQQPEKMTKYKKPATLAPVTIDTRNIDRLMAHGKDGDDMFASLLREIDNYGLSMTISPKDGTCILSELSAPSSTCGEDSFSSEKSTCGEPFKIFYEEEKEENSTMTATTSTTTTTTTTNPSPSLEQGDKSISITKDNCTMGDTMMNNGEEEDLSPTLRLRGLPYNAREDDVKEFFGYHARFLRADNPISLIPNRDGRPSGLAMACFVSQATARIAQRDLDRKMMGTRYIEVFGPLNHNTHRFMKNPGPMTEGMVLRELRALLRKKGSMLMSMLGVLLSDEGRQFLKSQGIGLKAFFQRVKDEFAIEGKEGEEKLFWLHPKNNPHTMSHGHMAPLGGHGQQHQHQHQHAQQHQHHHQHQHAQQHRQHQHQKHQHAQQQRQNGHHFSMQMNNHMNNNHGGFIETAAHPHNAAMGMGHKHQHQQQHQHQQHQNQKFSSERPKVHGRSKSQQHHQHQQPATHGTHQRNNFHGHKNTNAINGVSIGANGQNGNNGHRGYGKNGGAGGAMMTNMNMNKNKNIQSHQQKHQVQQYQQQQQQHSMSNVKKHMNYHGNNNNTHDKRFFGTINNQQSSIINHQGGSLTRSVSVDSFTPAVIPPMHQGNMGSYGSYDACAPVNASCATCY